MKQTVLHASVTASPYDEHYEMALVYCVDQRSRHCFSLTRFPGENEIEVMIVDQVLEKVPDLDVSLNGSCLTAKLPPGLAQRVGGVQQYVVHIDLSEDQLPNLISALKKIFEGKGGLKLLEA